MEEEGGGAYGFKVLWETSEIFLYKLRVLGGIVFSPQNSYVEALTPSTSECDLIWKQGRADVIG